MSDKAIIDDLKKQLKDKDETLYEHSKRLQKLAKKCVAVLDVDDEQKADIVTAALLHDIGILALPNALIYKTDRLSLDEYETLQTHVTAGLDLIEPLSHADRIAPMIKHHHENINGFGYPDGLSEEVIPYGARLIHIIEAFDSMVFPRRSTKTPFTPQQAITELNEFSGRIYDTEILGKIIPILLKTKVEVTP